MKTFDIKSFDLGKFDNILSRGLCRGVGDAAANAVSDEYLILSANLALEVLRDLKSPGVELL